MKVTPDIWLKVRNSRVVLGLELLAKFLGLFILLGVTIHLCQLLLENFNEPHWWVYGLALYGASQLALNLGKSMARDAGVEVED